MIWASSAETASPMALFVSVFISACHVGFPPTIELCVQPEGLGKIYDVSKVMVSDAVVVRGSSRYVVWLWS